VTGKRFGDPLDAGEQLTQPPVDGGRSLSFLGAARGSKP
jgi:hypothetical protein